MPLQPTNYPHTQTTNERGRTTATTPRGVAGAMGYGVGGTTGGVVSRSPTPTPTLVAPVYSSGGAGGGVAPGGSGVPRSRGGGMTATEELLRELANAIHRDHETLRGVQDTARGLEKVLQAERVERAAQRVEAERSAMELARVKQRVVELEQRLVGVTEGEEADGSGVKLPGTERHSPVEGRSGTPTSRDTMRPGDKSTPLFSETMSMQERALTPREISPSDETAAECASSEDQKLRELLSVLQVGSL